jgi:hypothetical protein
MELETEWLCMDAVEWDALNNCQIGREISVPYDK